MSGHKTDEWVLPVEVQSLVSTNYQ